MTGRTSTNQLWRGSVDVTTNKFCNKSHWHESFARWQKTLSVVVSVQFFCNRVCTWVSEAERTCKRDYKKIACWQPTREGFFQRTNDECQCDLFCDPASVAPRLRQDYKHAVHFWFYCKECKQIASTIIEIQTNLPSRIKSNIGFEHGIMVFNHRNRILSRELNLI